MVQRKPTPPTLVLMVRHGTTATTGKVLPGRARGLPLSDAGRAQALSVAERLSALPGMAAVYSSPLERTKQTAGPIARRLGLRVRTARDLVDCDFGDWTGKRLATLRKKPEWEVVANRPSTFRFPGGESFAEMRLRVTNQIERLVAAHPGAAVVAVSHADPIKAIVGDALGQHLDLFQRIVISPCSVSAILYGAGVPRVLTVNSTSDHFVSLTTAS